MKRLSPFCAVLLATISSAAACDGPGKSGGHGKSDHRTPPGLAKRDQRKSNAPSANGGNGRKGRDTDEGRCGCTPSPDRGNRSHTDSRKGNNGVGNGYDPQPPGSPQVNDSAGTGRKNPGAKGGHGQGQGNGQGKGNGR